MDINVEAKNHYISILCKSMAPIMIETFINMYKEAITRGKGNREATVRNFKVLLEDVTNWNNSIIQTHSKEYTTSCAYFSDLLAAVFVCYIKILSTVRMTKDSKKIQVKLPSNDNFIHACINNAATEFIDHMVIFREQDAMVRNKKLKDICYASINKTLDDLIPVQMILRTYINPESNEFEFGDTTHMEPETQEESEEEEEEAAPQLPDATPAQQDPVLPMPPVAELPPGPEVKQIPIQQDFSRPPLFPDAPDGREKIIHQQ
jgi:hypothetical protein